MKLIVLDTCVFINIIKESASGIKCIEALEKLGESTTIIASVVTKAELASFAYQNNWGAPKLEKLNSILQAVTFIDILQADETLINAYKKIDSFSKRRAADNQGNLLDGAARRMGKNDLWIAAISYALDAPLMTTDGDFDHLNGTLLEVIQIV